MKRNTNTDLEGWVQKLRDEGCSILETIKKVRERYHLSLEEAREAVHFSPAWAAERPALEKFEREFFEIWEKVPLEADAETERDVFHPYDLVQLTGGPPDLPEGARGVILEIQATAPSTCNVEFFSAGAAPLGVFTVKSSQLRRDLSENSALSPSSQWGSLRRNP